MAPSGNGGCYVDVSHLPVGEAAPLGSYIARSIADLRADDGVEIEGVGRGGANLTAGTSTVLDVSFTDGGDAREYLLTQDETLYTFGCFVPDGAPPEDRWRSIAETFEFLPAEEE